MSDASLSLSSTVRQPSVLSVTSASSVQNFSARAGIPEKAPEAFRTISEVAEGLNLPQHVLRFWEGKFHQIKPLKRGGGRRYYRPEDIHMLSQIKELLHNRGYTIRGVQKLLKENGAGYLKKSAAPSIVRNSDAGLNTEKTKAPLSAASREELKRVLKDLKSMKTSIESLDELVQKS
ncbi:MAG: MerR family transcriptional regulator [Alphaproteobacteria bacterium]|nr:MerR family transcriptional regulator [Alphaproteobacteria bacterium]MCL2505495.1 MerR family transcriptional regulator [Alphaproteobacteria bacterium]